MPATQAATPTPRFSVVIPTYRRAELLAQALRSVADQTYTDLEIIVVDDDQAGSARDVVNAFARQNTGTDVRYYTNHRARGGSGARNAGLEHAAGEWVAYLDDDDTWLPEKLQRISDLIATSTDPDLALVYSSHAKYDFEEQRVLETTRPQARGRVLDKVLYENCIGGMSVVVARRDLLQELGGLDERFQSLQDMELYVRVAERGTFDFVEEPLVRLRVSSRDRITYDPRKKLQGAKLFASKYSRLLAGSARLKHRAASRTFVFAMAANDLVEATKNLPWTLAGVVVDPSNLGYVFRSLARQLRARSARTVKTVRAATR